MISSPEDARSDMFSMVETVVNTLSSIISYVPEIRWQGLEIDTIPDSSKYWLRVTKLETDEVQKHVSTNGDVKLWNHIGVLSIELFGPTIDVTSWEKLQLLAKPIRDEFRGKYSPNGVYFPKAKILEVPNDNLWNKINVLVEYDYDERG